MPSTPLSRVTAESFAVVDAAAVEAPALSLPDEGRTLLGSGVRQAMRFRGPEPVAVALGENRARPLTLATADFDEDGIADVACGYALDGAGVVAVFRGNVDAIYPYAPEAQRRRAEGLDTSGAFVSPALVTALETAPELLVTGDFDADGHADLASARIGGGDICIVAGDGRGGFGATRRVVLTDRVTALAAGEVGLADGLADLAIAVEGPSGAAVTTLRSEIGAANAEPRVLASPSRVAGIAIGRLGDDCAGSLVLAAGSEVVVVVDAHVERVALAFEAVDVSIGRYSSPDASVAALGANGEIAVVERTECSWSARRVDAEAQGATRLVAAGVAATPRDAVVATGAGARLRVVTGLDRLASATAAAGTAIAAVAMRLNPDAIADLVVLEPGAAVPSVLATRGNVTIAVTNANDSGPGSLRETIFAVGASNGGTIVFNIPGNGPHTIVLATALPGLFDPITIDATSQPGFAGSPVVEIDSSAVADDVGLTLTAGASVIRGLSITGADGSGISIFGETGNIVEGNYIGVDVAGRAAPNALDGVTITSSAGNNVGGTTPAARNVLSGNRAAGVGLNTQANGNFIVGNYIGVDATGAAALPNGGDGINVGDSTLTTIGGTTSASRNVIAANAALGVGIFGASTRTLVQGNYIGMTAGGVLPLGNGADGVLVESATNALVGGTTVGAGNLISGNLLNGVALFDGAAQATIQGNTIGTNAAATVAVPNLGNGIYAFGAEEPIVGGAVARAANVVSGNSSLGIGLFAGTTGARIQGNTIGLGAGGAALGNFADGIYIEASNGTLVGGTGAGEANTIASNGASGILVISGVRNSVLGNSFIDNGWIGIDVDEPGIATNDPGDGDTGGNGALNYPVLTTVRSGATTTVRGVYNSAPGSDYRIELFTSPDCDPFGVGEGETFIGAAEITTDGTGTSQFAVTLPVSVAGGSVVTATATDAAGNTSEFSECAIVQLEWDPPAVEGGPPQNLTLTASDTAPMGGAAVAARASLTGYKVYRSATQPVQTTPGNFFTSVPPTQTNAMAPASSGGFFAVTACYDDGSESGPSNDANSPGAPVIASAALKGASKLLVDGANFTTSVLVIADGLPFVSPAKVKRQRTRVIQKGSLLTQQTLRQYLASRPVGPTGKRQVLVGVRNSTGAVTTILVEE